MIGEKKSKEILRELKWRIFGKTKYGKSWQEVVPDWYSEIHDSNYLVHEDFKEYFLKRKNTIRSVLEVGCGMGVYPIKNSVMFDGVSYTGIDISEPAISYCKKNSSFNFICGDFIKMQMNSRFDLVFSHAVVDHVYDIDKFIEKLVLSSNKYTYINSYRGYSPQLRNHKKEWNEVDGCYYNDLSVKQIHKLLIDIGLDEDEFLIRSQESGQKGQNVSVQTIIEVEKKSN